jgi:hypothetical protein
MTDDTQATDASPDAEPAVSATETAVVETPAQAPGKKKVGRGARAAKPAKAPKPAKTTRARNTGKSEEAVAPAPEVAAEPVAKTARNGKFASTAKAAKTAKPQKSAAPAKVAKPAVTAKQAKPEKATKTAKTAKPAKVATSPKKVAKAAPATVAKKAAPVAAGERDKGARYTANELSSAVRKAGLTVQFTPVVMASVNIGRGPAKEFKVDAMVAHLRGSNGDLIRDRGPGTPLYNDAESFAAVEIFEKFRGRTFHNKLKVEIL